MTPGLMTRLTLSACLPLSCLGLFLKTAGDYPTSFKNLPPGAIFKQKRKGHKAETPQPPRAQVGQCDACFSDRSQWYGPDPHAVIHLIAHPVTGFLPVLHSQITFPLVLPEITSPYEILIIKCFSFPFELSTAENPLAACCTH